jgi:hypothetical protein
MNARYVFLCGWSTAMILTICASQARNQVGNFEPGLEKKSIFRGASSGLIQAAEHPTFWQRKLAQAENKSDPRVCSLSPVLVKPCLDSCNFDFPTCTTVSCETMSATCTLPECCVSAKQVGAMIVTTECYKGCCIAVDQNGTLTTPYPCKPKGRHCFPGNALAELKSGYYRRLDRLLVGDQVKVSENTFSDVFMFTHKDSETKSEFVRIVLASSHSIRLTPGHYIYANGEVIPAGLVKVGDELMLGTGAKSAVVSVSTSVETGIYNPQTLHGDIVVDGVVSSTYTTALSPALGHATLAPLRLVYFVFGVTLRIFESGADCVARFLPTAL